MRISRIPLLFSFVVLSFACFTACEEPDNTLHPEVDPFDKLVVAQNVNVKLMNGNPDVSVHGQGDLSSVQLVVFDGILTVALPNPGSAQNVVVEIVHNDMVSASCTQNGSLNFATDFSTSAHTLTLTGYNNSAIYSYNKISVDTLDIKLSDDTFLAFTQVEVSKNKLTQWSGTLCFLEGNATEQIIEMSDDCSYNLEGTDSGWPFAGPLQAENTWVKAKNGAQAWVHATTYLNAVATTGSMVYYKGDPATIEEDMTNGAELIQKNE
jgi:hypothetical protein